jgi:ArsR family transcriptional regulator
MENSAIHSYKLQASFFKALSHPIRLIILNILREGEACVCHLEACLGKRQAYLSQQLAVLRESGLVNVRREGWNVYYAIKDERIYNLIDEAAAIIQTEAKPFSADTHPVKPCSCPKCTAKKEEGDRSSIHFAQ